MARSLDVGTRVRLTGGGYEHGRPPRPKSIKHVTFSAVSTEPTLLRLLHSPRTDARAADNHGEKDVSGCRITFSSWKTSTLNVARWNFFYFFFLLKREILSPILKLNNMCRIILLKYFSCNKIG